MFPAVFNILLFKPTLNKYPRKEKFATVYIKYLRNRTVAHIFAIE